MWGSFSDDNLLSLSSEVTERYALWPLPSQGTETVTNCACAK
jgi:hypothetical protein